MKNPTVVVGLVLSLAGGYAAVRGVEWPPVLAAMGRINPIALLVPTAWYSLFFVLRAYRWQRFVAPLEPLPVGPFLSATLIGFMANNILPLRLGELIRGYALSRLTPVRLSTALATAVLERVWDVFVVALLLVWVLPRFPLPEGLVRANTLLLALGVGCLVAGWWGVRYADSLRLAWLPERLAGLVRHGVDGLRALQHVSLLVHTVALSLAMWLSVAGYYWLLLWACGMDLPLEAGLVVMLVVAVVVALPAAPGFVGTFQYAVVFALSLFAVPQEAALSFSIIAHLAQLLPVILAGFIALLGSGLPLWPTRLLPAKDG